MMIKHEIILFPDINRVRVTCLFYNRCQSRVMFREYYEEMNNLNSDAFSAENLIKDHTSLEGEGLDIQEIKFSVQI